jgi:CRISPR-associated protein Cas2
MSRNTRRQYVIAYDVTDDSRRTRLASLLLDYGDRVQKSVFEADLNATEMQEMIEQAAKYIAAGDSLRIYPLCQSCLANIRSIGRKETERPGSLRVV